MNKEGSMNNGYWKDDGDGQSFTLWDSKEDYDRDMEIPLLQLKLVYQPLKLSGKPVSATSTFIAPPTPLRNCSFGSSGAGGKMTVWVFTGAPAHPPIII